ncbi:MAG: metal-dependent transcriptional regulator [Gracilibacteraceae bacterium]|jgi:Mn-dependent DtxR family transcriptional regulator|nr:metal-dependent transcriptional regulator [Gracilibacteraceae bacterium]
MIELTPAKENYIKAVYTLSRQGDGVRSLDVAAALGVSKPSVSRMIKELQQKNLVERTENMQVRLTPEGRRRAAEIDLRFYAVKNLLTETLGVDERTAIVDASFLEHIISPETLSCIIKHTKEKEGNRK